MVQQQAKANSSHIRRSDSWNVPNYQIDEALWADYRRYDKSAVTEKFLRHYLPGLALLVELNTVPDLGRESVRTKIISGRDRREGRFGQKTSTQTTPAYAKTLLRLTSKPGKGKRELCSALERSR